MFRSDAARRLFCCAPHGLDRRIHSVAQIQVSVHFCIFPPSRCPAVACRASPLCCASAFRARRAARPYTLHHSHSPHTHTHTQAGTIRRVGHTFFGVQPQTTQHTNITTTADGRLAACVRAFVDQPSACEQQQTADCSRSKSRTRIAVSSRECIKRRTSRCVASSSPPPCFVVVLVPSEKSSVASRRALAKSPDEDTKHSRAYWGFGLSYCGDARVIDVPLNNINTTILYTTHISTRQHSCCNPIVVVVRAIVSVCN